MIANAEIRDKEKLKHEQRKILVSGALFVVITIVCMILVYYTEDHTVMGRVGVIILVTSFIVFIPFLVIEGIKAPKFYKTSWIMKEFDFYVKDNCLYLDDKKLHVNYNKSLNEIYVHDLGIDNDPYKATFYGTVREPEVEGFLLYLKNNKVKIEKEVLPRLNGKFGFAAPFRIYKYRR